MKAIIAVTFLISLLLSDDFISEFEYGQMLYQSPRGVSCASCHGKLGEPTYVATLTEDNGSKVDFVTPDIRKLSIKKFRRALDKGGKIMPKYYLTDKEVEAIYRYIQEVNTQQKDGNSTTDDNIEDTIDDINITDDNDTQVEDENNNNIMSKIFKLPQEEQ